MAKQSKACEQDANQVPKHLPEVYYPLVSLLHTVREMAAHEDQICTLLTEIQRSGKMTASTRRELSAFITSFPAASLQQEVDAVAASLSQ